MIDNESFSLGVIAGAVSLDKVVGILRHYGVLALVSQSDEELFNFVVLSDYNPDIDTNCIGIVNNGAISYVMEAQKLVDKIGATLGVDISLDEYECYAREPEDEMVVDEEAPQPKYVLSKSGLGNVHGSANQLESMVDQARIGGWTLWRIHNPRKLHEYVWFKNDLPVILFDDCNIAISDSFGFFSGRYMLQPQITEVLTFDSSRIDQSQQGAYSMLKNYFKSEIDELSSDLKTVFRDLDVNRLAQALAGDADNFHAATIGALGLPAELTDILRSNRMPEDSVTVEPKSGLGALKDTYKSFENYKITDSHGGSLIKFYSFFRDHPWVNILFIAAELGIAIWIITTFYIDEGSVEWWVYALTIIAVLLLIDAIGDLVLTVRRIARRR